MQNLWRFSSQVFFMVGNPSVDFSSKLKTTAAADRPHPEESSPELPFREYKG